MCVIAGYTLNLTSWRPDLISGRAILSSAAPADRDLDLRRELQFLVSEQPSSRPPRTVPVVSPGFPAFFNDPTTVQT